MYYLWYFHESLLSTVMPRNLMNEITSEGVSSKIIFMGSVSIALLNNIYFVFWKLMDSLLAFIHWVTFSSSEFKKILRNSIGRLSMTDHLIKKKKKKKILTKSIGRLSMTDHLIKKEIRKENSDEINR